MALQAPINYALDIQSPFQAAAQGYTFGSQIRADQQAQEDRLKKQFSEIAAEKQKAVLSEGWQTLAALKSKNIQVVQDLMNNRAAALRNDGDENQAKAYETAAKAAETDPVWAENTIKYIMQSIDPDFGTRYAQLEGGDGSAKFQRGEGTIVDINGEQNFSVPVFNPQTGTYEVVTKPVGGQVVAKGTGLTPEAASNLEISTEEGKALARIRAGVGTAEDQAIAAAIIEQGKTSGGKQAEQQAEFVNLGIAAVDTLPELYQATNLLKSIKTGGKFNEVSQWARQTFGIETADEGELSYLLGKNVLQQLRPTFGAAFTVNEKNELKGIESGFGKNNETNIRLLGRVIAISERSARRGLVAAKQNKDEFSAQEIKRGLDELAKLKATIAEKPTASVRKPKASDSQPIEVDF